MIITCNFIVLQVTYSVLGVPIALSKVLEMYFGPLWQGSLPFASLTCVFGLSTGKIALCCLARGPTRQEK